MKAALLILTLFISTSLSETVPKPTTTDQEKLTEFMWGLDFGMGATKEFNTDHSNMNLLLKGDSDFQALKKI